MPNRSDENLRQKLVKRSFFLKCVGKRTFLSFRVSTINLLVGWLLKCRQMLMSVSANVLFCPQLKDIEFSVSSEERKPDNIHI